MRAKKMRGEYQYCGDCGKLLNNVGYMCDKVPTKARENTRPMRCADCADAVCTEEKHGEDCNTTTMW